MVTVSDFGRLGVVTPILEQLGPGFPFHFLKI